MEYPLALRATLHFKKHELFFGFQRLGIKNSALAGTSAFERSAAVGAGFRQRNVQNAVGFVLLQSLSAVSLVPVPGTALARLIFLKTV